MLIGAIPGSIGETSALMCIIGAFIPNAFVNFVEIGMMVNICMYIYIYYCCCCDESVVDSLIECERY